MKDIRLFKKIFAFMVSLVVILLATVQAQVSSSTFELKGKVSYKIETKTLTQQQAQNAINNKTIIPLRLSLIFEGDWVSLFDQNFEATMNSSSFAFGIAQKQGLNETDAPLYNNDPPAWICASPDLACKAPDGGALETSPSTGMYLRNPSWTTTTCPQFAYGALFVNNNDPLVELGSGSSKFYDTIINGKKCYVVNLFNLYFRLKRLETVYVRGIDCNNADDLDKAPWAQNTDTESNVDPATSRTTELNIVRGRRVFYWPDAPKESGAEYPEAADWTLAPSDYYGGIIPGGIFIETVPEAEQFEPRKINLYC